MDTLLKQVITDYDPANLMFSSSEDGWFIAVYKLNSGASYVLVAKDNLTILSSIQVDIVEWDQDIDQIMQYDLPDKLKEDFRLRIDEMSEYLMYKVWVK